MPKLGMWIHKSTCDRVDFIASLLETSRSEVVQRLLDDALANEQEYEVWEDLKDYEKEFEEALEKARKEAESGEEGESEEEEEEQGESEDDEILESEGD